MGKEDLSDKKKCVHLLKLVTIYLEKNNVLYLWFGLWRFISKCDSESDLIAMG